MVVGDNNDDRFIDTLCRSTNVQSAISKFDKHRPFQPGIPRPRLSNRQPSQQHPNEQPQEAIKVFPSINASEVTLTPARKLDPVKVYPSNTTPSDRKPRARHTGEVKPEDVRLSQAVVKPHFNGSDFKKSSVPDLRRISESNVVIPRTKTKPAPQPPGSEENLATRGGKASPSGSVAVSAREVSRVRSRSRHGDLARQSTVDEEEEEDESKVTGNEVARPRISNVMIARKASAPEIKRRTATEVKTRREDEGRTRSYVAAAAPKPASTASTAPADHIYQEPFSHVLNNNHITIPKASVSSSSSSSGSSGKDKELYSKNYEGSPLAYKPTNFGAGMLGMYDAMQKKREVNGEGKERGERETEEDEEAEDPSELLNPPRSRAARTTPKSHPVTSPETERTEAEPSTKTLSYQQLTEDIQVVSGGF